MYNFEQVWVKNSLDKRLRFLSDFKSCCLLTTLSKVFQNCFESSKGELFALLSLGLDMLQPSWGLRHLDGELSAALTRFRLGNHHLPIERGRWNNTPRNERLCERCDVLGDEHHAVFSCHLFDDLRVPLHYELCRYRGLTRELAVCEVLDTKDVRFARKLSRFLLRMEKRLCDIHSVPIDPDLG